MDAFIAFEADALTFTLLLFPFVWHCLLITFAGVDGSRGLYRYLPYKVYIHKHIWYMLIAYGGIG